MVECSSVLEECSTSVFRVSVRFRWMLKWLERKGCVSCEYVGGGGGGGVGGRDAGGRGVMCGVALISQSYGKERKE
jgi:hypothetical protein